jgi:quinol monooxygenase YgiN
MFIVHVYVHIKLEFIDDFRQATVENARKSLLEPGVARFDVIQDLDEPTHFVLIEVYRAEEDPAKHKETAHYQIWRDTVADMMAEPRFSVRYVNRYPEDEDWG